MSFFESPAWRAKEAWFQVTEDLRTQGWRVAGTIKENIRFKSKTGQEKPWGLAVH